MAIISAASVILVRPGSAGRARPDIYWLRRNPELRFLAGFHVFPGGRVEEADGSPAVAAVRECFEETGVLLVPGAGAIDAEARRAQRLRLLADETDIASVLSELGLRLDPSLLPPAGRWLTPPFARRRFDTRFFIAVVPPDQEPEVIHGELVSGAWLDPADAAARWRADDAMLAAPTKVAIDVLSQVEGDPRDPAALAAIGERVAVASPNAADWGRRIELRPGLFVIPVRSPTLPPATHTNVVLLGDGRDLIVVDPGAEDPGEQAMLHALIDELVDEGRRIREVVLTHYHRDHVAGAAVLADRYSAPIAAHPLTADALLGEVGVDRRIEPDELHDLPADRDGATAARRVRIIHTPGHTRGHVVLHEETTGVVAAGDLVANGSYIIVDPPEGNMGDYLDSLARVARLAEGAMGIPAHGGFVGDLGAHCRDYVRHRLEREGKVRDALRAADGPAAMAAVLERAYDDTPREMWPFAERSALAHLLKLVADGEVARGDDDAWTLTADRSDD